MSGGVYGGDEVGALVFDAGHYTFRAGYAGEETPKADIPSVVGVVDAVLDDIQSDSMDIDENKSPIMNGHAGPAKKGKDYKIDENSVRVPKAGMEMSSFLKDGMIEDWDIFESFLDYIYKRRLTAESKLHPVLISEAPWNKKDRREKLTELMFEKYDIPAFYVCKNAVLAAFSNGRSSGLVLDSGSTHTSAIPVYDGFCYGNAVVKTPLGGDALTQQCLHMLERMGVDIVPPYQIGTKEPVQTGQQPKWKKKQNIPEVTKSFHNYMVKGVVQDFQAAVLQLGDTPYETENVEKIPGLGYEFPNGYNKEFVSERVTVPEGLFDLSFLKNIAPEEQSSLMAVPQVVQTSIGMCDIDIRPAMYAGLIVTGGNTLVPGFVERLTYDLQQKCPANSKLKILAAPIQTERRFGAWIGGSILASLGTFQQMWVSRSEYDETGKTIVERKCP